MPVFSSNGKQIERQSQHNLNQSTNDFNTVFVWGEKDNTKKKPSKTRQLQIFGQIDFIKIYILNARYLTNSFLKKHLEQNKPLKLGQIKLNLLASYMATLLSLYLSIFSA